MSNVEDAKQAVARTPAEWAALWRLHAGDQAARRRSISRTRMVVAVFLGTRPSAGYAVEMTGTKPDGKTLVVEWREQPPKPGNVSAQVITSPAHLVSIPKFDGEITVPESRTVTEPTSTGVDARLSSVLCYAGWWVTGLVFLFAERRHSGVRFHAAQSIVVFGALSVALFLCGGASAVAFFMAVPTFQIGADDRQRAVARPRWCCGCSCC